MKGKWGYCAELDWSAHGRGGSIGWNRRNAKGLRPPGPEPHSRPRPAQSHTQELRLPRIVQEVVRCRGQENKRDRRECSYQGRQGEPAHEGEGDLNGHHKVAR